MSVLFGPVGPPARTPPQRTLPLRRVLPVGGVLLTAGLLLGVAASSARRDAPAVSRERSALSAQVGVRSREVAGLTAAVTRLRRQVEDYRRAALRGGGEARTTTAVVRRLEPVTGAAAVRGPGVAVRLNDAARPAGTARVAGSRIRDTDLSQVVNALWSAGAEAIAVNGVRLTGGTAIRSAGDAILVNFRPLSPPYTVSAIGSPDRLAAGYAASAVAARLRTASAVYGVVPAIRSADRLLLPAVDGLGLRVTVARIAGRASG